MRSTSVHSHRFRKIQCTELLGSRTLLILDVRYFVCSNPKCGHTIFSEPLSMTRPYGRHTYEAEERIRHENEVPLKMFHVRSKKSHH